MMNDVDNIGVLNRMVAIHHRSLPTYLSYASPTWHRGDSNAQETLAAIAADQRATVDRLGEIIVDHDRAVNYGAYPMAFTGYHDLSFDFLLNKLIERQQRDVAEIEACVGQLPEASIERAVAEDALGAALGHLDSLLELRPGKAP